MGEFVMVYLNSGGWILLKKNSISFLTKNEEDETILKLENGQIFHVCEETYMTLIENLLS